MFLPKYAGYEIAFSLALDNLKNGNSVIADSTNPIKESRDAWINVANLAQVPFIEIEVVCSNKEEHRKRVESRQSDIYGLVLPNWESVSSREYQHWFSAKIVLDTAGKTPSQSKEELQHLLISHVKS